MCVILIHSSHVQYGDTTLMWAASGGHTAIVQYLVERTTAQVNATNEAPKVQMPRWNDTVSTNTTIHHSTNTATADVCIQDFCTVQCFSYAIRSQSVLTTI